MSFASATSVRSLDAGRYRADVAEGWDIFGVPNGGYLLSIAGRAMGMEAEGRDLASITGYYLNRATPGPVELQVEVLKAGSALTMIGARMEQQGRALISAQAVFANRERRRAEGLIVEGSPPDLPPPEECVHLVPAGDAPLPPPFVSKVEVALHPEDVLGGSSRRGEIPRVRGWFSLATGESPDALAIVQATDAFPPAVFNSSLPPGWTPTIELTVHIREPGPFDRLGCEFRTRFVTGGWLEEDGELWDASGRLVAQSRQLALVTR